MESKHYTGDIQKSFGDLITKKINLPGILKNAAITILGVAALVTASAIEGDPSTWTIALFTAGIVIIVWGTGRVAFRRQRYLYIPTASPVSKTSIPLEGKSGGRLVAVLGNAGAENAGIGEGKDLSGGRLDVWVSRDRDFAAIQLFRYRPHEFYAVSPLIRIGEKELDTLSGIAPNRIPSNKNHSF